jgi:predicted TIM-barrel fold metal-dependent hydrolase
VTDSDKSFGRPRALDPAWLAAAEPEEVIDPGQPIVDAAHHLYGPDSPMGTYLLDEFLADCADAHRVVATVHVQCGSFYRPGGSPHLRSVGETEALAGLAAISESGSYGPTRVAAGIVGHADLADDRAAAVLDAHLAAGGGRFRGVRDPAAYDDDPRIGNWVTSGTTGRYVSPAFHAGVKQLFDRQLSLDALVFFHQLPDVVHLARTFPEGNIILGHCGTPLGYGRHEGKRQEIFAVWRSHMTELARCENVSVKLGGLMIRLAAYDYLSAARPATSAELAEAWAPYIETCIELFGARRCMVQSNFPVEKMGVTHRALFNAFKRLIAAGSDDEKHDILCSTAMREYRLDAQVLAATGTSGVSR